MKYKVTLNGRTYEVIVEKGEAILADEYDAMAPAVPVAPVARETESVGTSAAATASAVSVPAAPVADGETITAPLPGTVVSVDVTAGQTVRSGDILAIIEAMKMENEVLAPRDGTVAQVITSQGAAVKTGDPLVVLS